ncbi:hypothetical protein G7Y89_g1819 [Cudoniella acicularis]|uniref:Uncharacterized protein n=1 Tax=Cudoniella acicularis TaxID=354080 RepID=A0A8H4W9X6_9HELO|nr:hypothetical protein G7Y89_g1819 [Cudoniella acicularis]
MSQLSRRSGGPYSSDNAGIGGLPSIIPDIPICAVFIAIYICFAATNQLIFRTNHRRHHKFVLSLLLFGFSMARIVTLVLRIAWANRQHNIRLAIAAQIFLNAGILIIYILNLILAQRILRAMQPQIGWNPVLRTTYKVLYITIGLSLAMVITSVVLSLYTLDTHTRSTCRDIQLAALTYLLIFTCLPLIHIAAAILSSTPKNVETFGEGTMSSKLIIVSLSTCLCMLIAGFKAGITWSAPQPATSPPWYDSKACFYLFNFTCEVLILSILTFSRIDKRFFVPDGCKQAGDYTRLRDQDAVEEKNDPSKLSLGDDRMTRQQAE